MSLKKILWTISVTIIFYRVVYVAFVCYAAIDLASFQERVPHVFVSGDNVFEERYFITDLVEENKHELISYLWPMEFRKPKYMKRGLLGVSTNNPESPARIDIKIQNALSPNPKPLASKEVIDLWEWLEDEMRDDINLGNFKLPYLFAFELTHEEHSLCEEHQDKILDILKNKKTILTWVTPEIQWSDILRKKYLRSYVEQLRKKGYLEWAQIIERMECER